MKWCTKAVVMMLLVTAFIIPVLVNAEDIPADDNPPGWSVDAEIFLTDIIVYGEPAFSNPLPKYRWGVEEWQEDGKNYAQLCAEYSEKLYNRNLDLFVWSDSAPPGFDRAAARNNPEFYSSLTNQVKYHTIDKESGQYYAARETYCSRAQKSYQQALSMTKDDDYKTQAEIFESASGMYGSMGNTKAQQQTLDAAATARAHQAASSLFDLPLPAWVAVGGITAGLFLWRRRQS